MDDITMWWKQAQKDFEVAQSLCQIKHYYAAAFFCQQAAEKGLKALYMKSKHEKPTQTHSLVYLASNLGADRKYFQLLKNLSSDFITARYPDITESLPYENYTKEILDDYVKQMKELMEWIGKKLSAP